MRERLVKINFHILILYCAYICVIIPLVHISFPYARICLSMNYIIYNKHNYFHKESTLTLRGIYSDFPLLRK